MIAYQPVAFDRSELAQCWQDESTMQSLFFSCAFLLLVIFCGFYESRAFIPNFFLPITQFLLLLLHRFHDAFIQILFFELLSSIFLGFFEFWRSITASISRVYRIFTISAWAYIECVLWCFMNRAVREWGNKLFQWCKINHKKISQVYRQSATEPCWFTCR